jgi:hypothetical protein
MQLAIHPKLKLITFDDGGVRRRNKVKDLPAGE